MSLRGRLTDLWGFEDESNPSKDRPFRDLWRFWSCNDVCPTCGIYEQSSHQYINFSSDPSVEPLRYWTKLRCIEARFENMAIFFCSTVEPKQTPMTKKACGERRCTQQVDGWLASPVVGKHVFLWYGTHIRYFHKGPGHIIYLTDCLYAYVFPLTSRLPGGPFRSIINGEVG